VAEGKAIQSGIFGVSMRKITISEWAASWLRGGLSGRALQTIAIALAAIAGIGFFAAELAMFGFILPHDWWRALAIASSAASLPLCVLF
jgi:hypothetical protein